MKVVFLLACMMIVFVLSGTYVLVMAWAYGDHDALSSSVVILPLLGWITCILYLDGEEMIQ